MLLLVINIFVLFVTVFVAGVLVGVLVFPTTRKKVSKFIENIGAGFGAKNPDLMLQRPVDKPILTPRANLWEDEAVLNPAAIILNDQVHLIYRAIGRDGVSRLGYASSADGFAFDRQYRPAFAVHNPGGHGAVRHYSPTMYPSGGSWGGVEDPRMVVIDDNVYVTFNLFDNWVLRVGVISMGKKDFLAKNFHKWRGPTILSSSNREKNWMLFPEKINGKFAILHGIIDNDSNRVRIEYTDSLDTLAEHSFETVDPQQVPDTHIAWHKHVRSAGPPPLKTPDGWLVLYHAHDDEGDRYKLGAMLLDLDDPTKILHRAPHPILEPDVSYENNGKPGVIYACGAVVKDGVLFVYYGGADKITAVATTPLKEFLYALTHDETPALQKENTVVSPD
ncbi:MAG TPA: hypothetical protein ENJ75_02410 [Candidatus Kaiserbacteria bacterium]|nr:hypothetical protein [Candidatus Kaiserbacteria bacterium]